MLVNYYKCVAYFCPNMLQITEGNGPHVNHMLVGLDIAGFIPDFLVAARLSDNIPFTSTM